MTSVSLGRTPEPEASTEKELGSVGVARQGRDFPRVPRDLEAELVLESGFTCCQGRGSWWRPAPSHPCCSCPGGKHKCEHRPFRLWGDFPLAMCLQSAEFLCAGYSSNIPSSTTTVQPASCRVPRNEINLTFPTTHTVWEGLADTFLYSFVPSVNIFIM